MFKHIPHFQAISLFFRLTPSIKGTLDRSIEGKYRGSSKLADLTVAGGWGSSGFRIEEPWQLPGGIDYASYFAGRLGSSLIIVAFL